MAKAAQWEEFFFGAKSLNLGKPSQIIPHGLTKQDTSE